MRNGIWIIVCTLLSLNASAQTVVYSEDFQSGIPVSYTLIDNDGLTPHASVSEFAPAWISLVDPDDSTYTDTVVGSTSYFDPAGFADRWIITPPIVLGQYGNFLYWEGKSHDASFPDGYQVLVSKTDTQTASFDTVYTVIIESADWNAHSVNLSEDGFDNETVYIAFRNTTYDGFKLYLDDISVEIEDPVGLEEYTSAFFVKQNPFDSEITIICDDLQEARLFALDGQLVKVSTNSVINTPDLESGAYYLIVTTDRGSFSKKLIKR